MKKSNIIILASIGFIIITNIWMAVDAKNKFESMFTNENPVTENIETEVDLETFNHIVIAGDSKVNLKFNSRNAYSVRNNQASQLNIINDTLYIDENSHLKLYCINVKSIKLMNNAKLDMEKTNGKYLYISASGDSRFTAQNPTFKKLDLYSIEDARLIINNSNIDTTNILASENSRIGINGKLEIVRGELTDNSNLSVSGANNTQFSKKGNAKINMY